mmetsp:Transcript_12082/g.18665  ORF Transcript_12082/g.18665 Transcript_12082/m.18665 type:complete len:118 (-) Transcript_12082:2046-2399(-)
MEYITANFAHFQEAFYDGFFAEFHPFKRNLNQLRIRIFKRKWEACAALIEEVSMSSQLLSLALYMTSQANLQARKSLVCSWTPIVRKQKVDLLLEEIEQLEAEVEVTSSEHTAIANL